MPELSGPELATRIRTVHPAIRVLLVSGYSADAVARHGVDGAAPSFLQKPFTGQQLGEEGARGARRRPAAAQRAAPRWCCNDARSPPWTREADRLEALRVVRDHRHPARSRFRRSRGRGRGRGRGAAGLHRLRGRDALVGQGVGGSGAARAAARRRSSAPSRLRPPSRWSWTTSAPIRASRCIRRSKPIRICASTRRCRSCSTGAWRWARCACRTASRACSARRSSRRCSAWRARSCGWCRSAATRRCWPRRTRRWRLARRSTGCWPTRPPTRS